MSIIPSGQKFRTADASVDTTERRSAKLNNMIEFYTMADIVGTVSSQINTEGSADSSSLFNTKALMVADASLVENEVVETRGYTTAGDGGATVYTVSATGTADGGSVIALSNGLFAVTDFGGTTCATQWGAVRNNSASGTINSVAFNAMFLYVANTGGDMCSVNVTTGNYSIADTILLPQSLGANEEPFHLEFNNSELIAVTDNITLLKRVYKTGQESSKISILNANFSGVFRDGVTGVDIQGGYNCQIINGDFYSLAKGIELGFALNTHMYNLKFTTCLRGVNIGLLGGTNTNGQSNVSTMEKCRFYSPKLSDYALHIDRVSGVVITNCIFEGNQPTVANIHFNGQSSVVNDCTIIGSHADSAGHANSGNNTHVEFTGGARLKLYQVFAQATNTHVDPDNIVSGREIINITGSNAYTDLSMYYWSSSFSIRNDSNGFFNMTDTQLNTTLPNDLNAVPITWTGTVGEPLYFAIERANDGIGTSRGRGINTSDTGGGVRHTHFHRESGVDTLIAFTYDAHNGSYEGNTARTTNGRNFYCPVAFDQKVVFTNDDHIIGTTPHSTLTTTHSNRDNAVSVELESGETGRYDHTLCPASGRPTVYTATAAPSTASDAGKKGEIRTDASNMYICIADNTWVKSALTSF